MPTSLDGAAALCGEGRTPPASTSSRSACRTPTRCWTARSSSAPAPRRCERGVRTRDVFAAVEAVAADRHARGVMTYWNLVDRYGVDAFARDLANAGGAG